MDNINEEIQKKIDYIAKQNNIYHSGKVVKINSFIIEVTGLDDAFYFEKVIIGDENNIGYVDKIMENKVIISLVKTNNLIKIGDLVTTTGEVLQAAFSKDSIGMIIDPFGFDKMTGKKINNSVLIPVETPKIGIMDRKAVNRPMETGIASIDLMFPIGRGQRQLIIGDKKTGKTQICLDTIVNQKDKNVICIYVSIGKTKKELKRLYSKLVEKGAHSYTLIVATFNDDMVPLIKLTPYVALSIAELYMREGKDVLVCIDDLKKHADACREIALIAEKNTGRDAYPADIFYTHSRLLEKGCQFKNGGSITILPIVETKGGDITDYISTNIISITDGQIVLSEKMFKKGQKPALNYGLSVSRLGSAVQKEGIKKIGAKVRQELLSYLETADVYQLVNIESMSEELKEKIQRGQKILDLLKQPKFYSFNENMLIEKFGFILDDNNTKIEQLKNDNENSDKNNNTSLDDNLNATLIDNSIEEDNANDTNDLTTENIEQEPQELLVDESKIEPNEEIEVHETSKIIPDDLKDLSDYNSETQTFKEEPQELLVDESKIEPNEEIEVHKTSKIIPEDLKDLSDYNSETQTFKEEPQELLVDENKVESNEEIGGYETPKVISQELKDLMSDYNSETQTFKEEPKELLVDENKVESNEEIGVYETPKVISQELKDLMSDYNSEIKKDKRILSNQNVSLVKNETKYNESPKKISQNLDDLMNDYGSILNSKNQKM